MRRVLFLLVIVVLSSFIEQDGGDDKIISNFDKLVKYVPLEKIYLHTDKSTYVVGETVWFRAYMIDGVYHLPVEYSRFIYVDLVDRRDSLISRVKIAPRDSSFYGYIRIPETLQQGDYCLRGYTYFMQNSGPDYFFNKKLRVINSQDSRVRTELSYDKNRGNNYTLSIRMTGINGEPLSTTSVSYAPAGYKGSLYPRRTRTDKDGVMKIKVDTTMGTLKMEFPEGEPFPFKRDIFIPRSLNNFDIQFFPEGGELISNNWQNIAFKAIGEDGMAIDVSGEILQDTVVIGLFNSLHDGMGKFKIPVSPGYDYQARIKLPSGESRIFKLPPSSSTALGLSVNCRDSILNYSIMKGENAHFPDSLYMMIHCRGKVYVIMPIKQQIKGLLNTNLLPEGIAHMVLVDGRGRVYSQRLFFVKQKDSSQIEITPNKSSYSSRELVTLDIGFREDSPLQEGGVFSLSVTDDGKVPIDSLENNIVSDILLTSDLKGYIDNPAYYFDENNPDADEHLDLVMLTHGWSRFDVSKIVQGDFGEREYPLERGQTISGKVERYSGKSAEDASIMLISNRLGVWSTQTDREGNFLVENISFRDSTGFIVQALNAKGKKRVAVTIDRDEFLPITFPFPLTPEKQREEERFFKEHGQDYYYDNGEKIYILNDVIVTKKRTPKNHTGFDHLARFSIDSARVAESGYSDLLTLLQMELGLMLERDSAGEEYLSYFGRRQYVEVNGFEESLDYVRLIEPKAILSISLFDQMQSFMLYGDRAKDGALLITYQIGYVPPSLGPLNIVPFTLLGYQVPIEFYVPKYDVDSVRRDNKYDTRSTIYWNPVVKIISGERERVSFYTADTPGRYSVIIEGITRDGIISRKRVSLNIK